MSERLSNNTNSDEWTGRFPPSEWVYNNTDVPSQPADRFALGPTGMPTAEEAMLEYQRPAPRYENNMPSAENTMLESASSKEAPVADPFASSPTGIPTAEEAMLEYQRPAPSYENNMTSAENAMLDTSEQEQQYNLQKHAKERQTARETVESILANDEKMLEKVQKIAFNDNIRSEFLKDYKDEIGKVITENYNDYSPEASTRVNKFAEDYLKVILMMDNLQRESGDRLINVASNSYDVTGEEGGLRQLSEFLQKRRKNSCDVSVAVPIKYSDENPHPKMDGVLVTNWLDQRLNQHGANMSNSTSALKAQIRKNLQQ